MGNANLLEKHRKKIDLIDNQLLALLNQRARIATEIGRIKAENGEGVFSVERESEILSRLADNNKGPVPHESLEDIFRTIFTTCRSLQKQLEIAFLGPEATFTHQVAIKHFGRNAHYTALPSIKDVFFEVDRRRVDHGVVPIENSTEGVVNHTLDMFLESKLHIVAEREEPISHNLLSVSGRLRNIKTVFSHPQALAQCRKWLEARLPHVVIQESASTADAAIKATLDGSAAAIASMLAAQMYHLKPVALNIEDTSDNATRFLVIGHTVPRATGRDKTSIIFSMKDRVGALYDTLLPFRKAGINLTKIESRPTKRKAWEYVFFVDFIGHQSESRIQKALAQLRSRCSELKVLGSYPYGV